MEMEDPVKMKPIRRTKQSLPDQCKMKRTGFIMILRWTSFNEFTNIQIYKYYRFTDISSYWI